MAPTIGRIVHYHVGKEGSDVRPAIITHVWETSVNLVIFNDGSYEPGQTIPMHRTSVTEGNDEGQWSWPPIE